MSRRRYRDLDEAFLRDELTFRECVQISIERDRAAGLYDHYAGETPRVKRDYREVLGYGLRPVRVGQQMALAL